MIGHKKENYEEHNAGIIVSEIDPLSIERIFSQTKQLNGQAIVDFVRCLCKVLTKEYSLRFYYVYRL